MKKIKVLHPAELPVIPLRLIDRGVLLWLLLDRKDPPGWVWGVGWTIYALVVLAALIQASRQATTRVLTTEEA